MSRPLVMPRVRRYRLRVRFRPPLPVLQEPAAEDHGRGDGRDTLKGRRLTAMMLCRRCTFIWPSRHPEPNMEP